MGHLVFCFPVIIYILLFSVGYGVNKFERSSYSISLKPYTELVNSVTVTYLFNEIAKRYLF